jgi:hypothetical protein
MMEAFRDWPEVCDVSGFTPTISITKLLPDQKQLLWRHLKSFHPDKAQELALIMNDPNVLEILDCFGAELLLEEKFVPDNLRWLVKK